VRTAQAAFLHHFGLDPPCIFRISCSTWSTEMAIDNTDKRTVLHVTISMDDISLRISLYDSRRKIPLAPLPQFSSIRNSLLCKPIEFGEFALHAVICGVDAQI
jgi:hypothetical protein